jgi:hypothetical protein
VGDAEIQHQKPPGPPRSRFRRAPSRKKKITGSSASTFLPCLQHIFVVAKKKDVSLLSPFQKTCYAFVGMRVAVRDLALLVAVASGSAEAFAGFAPAPNGLGLRSGVVAPQRALTTVRAVTTGAVRGANGVAALSANLKNADKIGKIVPKTWKEGTDFTKASKVRPDAAMMISVFICPTGGAATYSCTSFIINAAHGHSELMIFFMST